MTTNFNYHLVLISTSYPISHDGSEAAGSFVADFAQTLSNFVQVTVIAPDFVTKTENITPALTIQRFKVPTLPLSSLKPTKNIVAIWKTLRAGLQTLENIVQQQPVHHIFALWALPSGYWAKKIGQRYDIPYSTWALGSDIWSLGNVPIVKNVLKNVLQQSHRNFADGYLLKESVEQLAGRTCHFLPSTRQLSISAQKQLATQPPYKLAFLGRWHPNKGIDLLLESLTILNKIDWQRIEKIKIAGGGVLEDSVKSTCKTLQTQSYPIELYGYLDKKAAVDLFLWADYVLIPSRIESIPVVFSDAMKCRCPIVSMPVGDLPRLVNEYQIGELAQTLSAHDFAHAISRILQQSPQHFANQLIHASHDFSLDHAVETLLLQLDVQ